LYSEWDSEAVWKHRGVRPEQIVDYLALAGDQADNVPGVKGIGDKTAVKLLSEFKSLDEQKYHNISTPEPVLIDVKGILKNPTWSL